MCLKMTSIITLAVFSSSSWFEFVLLWIPIALGNMFKINKAENHVKFSNIWEFVILFCIRFDCWGNQSGGCYLLRKAIFSWKFHNDSPSLETLYNSHKNV